MKPLNINFKITSVFEAHDEINDGWPTRIITLLGGADAHFMPHLGDHHLIQLFDDVEGEDVFGWALPTVEMVQNVLNWTADLTEDDRLLIHCRAGKSRSTAMMIGILMQHGSGPLDALDSVLARRRIAIPNRLMIKQIDGIMKMQGVLIDVVNRFYTRNKGAGFLLPNRGGNNL